MSVKTLVFSSSAEESETTLLKVIQKCSEESDSNVFCVGLSGGSLTTLLSRILPKLTTNWKKWKFFFCDERLVSFDDPESTFGTYRSLLRTSLPQIQLDQFITIDQKLNSSDSAKDYEKKLRDVFGDTQWPRFDLLLLGMGPDGHTCSLFPNHSLLKECNSWVAAITDSPKPPPQRITLTLPVINNSKNCVFYSIGASKAEVIKEVLVDRKPLPAALVRPTAGRLIWILDRESARLIGDEMTSSLNEL